MRPGSREVLELFLVQQLGYCGRCIEYPISHAYLQWAERIAVVDKKGRQVQRKPHVWGARMNRGS